MATGTTEISIERSPDDIWKVIRDFGGLTDWAPGIDSCTVDGDVRTLSMMGMEIKEQLRELDDDARRIAYSVIASPMENLESHLATITISPEGSGSHVTYDVEVLPDELLPIFQGAYEGSVKAMKSHFEA
jgi:mxaD protein